MQIKNETKLDDYLFWQAQVILCDLKDCLPAKYKNRIEPIRALIADIENDYTKENENGKTT